MTISTTRRSLHLVERTLGDYQAVRCGRIGKRIINRTMGRGLARLMRGVWR